MPDDTESQLGRRTFLKATGAAGAAAAVGATQVSMAESTDRPEDKLLVTVSGAASVQTAEVEIQEALPSGADVVWRNDNMNVMSVMTPEGASTQAVDRIKRQLESRADVKYVEENQVHELHAVDDPGLDQQYAPQQTNAVDVWADGFLGSDDIDVAIFDTGVDYNHENLADRFGSDLGIAPGDRGDDPMDDGQHGTHVAGIASATTDNGTGMAGQSNSRLWAVKVFPNATSQTTIESLDWAIQQGIDVVNGSYGGGQPTDAERQAFQRALDNGVLPFFSAGNDGPRGDSVSFPGAYDETICVSALQEGEAIARFSSRGPEVNITGPGADVLSTVPGDNYDSLSGTSMSSPAVAGVAALGWGTDPSLSATQLRAALFETARDVGLSSNEQGAGCADAARLVEELGGGGEPPEGDNELTFSDQVLGDDGAVTVSDVSSDQASTIAVTYTDGDEEIIAGLAAADNLSGDDVGVEIEDAGGFPGEHTAWLFDDADVPGGVDIGVDASPIADAALDADSALVTDELDEPQAVIEASTTDPEVGEDVDLDGTASDSPNGDIVEYVWSAEGASVEGPTATLGGRDTETSVDVTLQVTDETGETDSTTKTFEFGDSGPVCGEEDYTGSASGDISWWNNSDTYSFSTQTSNPCQVEFDLDGPSDADFDLFVTLDGRTPSPDDFDESSESSDANETIVVDVPEDTASVDFGILVQGIAGWGSYTLNVEELGF